MSYGTILEVSTRTAGTSLDASASLGDSTIVLMDVTNMPSSGSLQIEGVQYDYSSINTSTRTVTLVGSLFNDLGESQPVFFLPLVTEKWALVELQPDDDAVSALVPYSLVDKIGEGIRDPDAREIAIIYKQQRDWVIVDILGSEDRMTVGFIQSRTGTGEDGPLTGWSIDKDGQGLLSNLTLLTGLTVMFDEAGVGRSELDSIGLNLMVPLTNPDGIDGLARIYVQDDALFIQSLGRGSDGASVQFVTPNGSNPGFFGLFGSGFLSDLNRSIEANDGTVLSGITSATPVLGTPTVGFTFKAPPSGCVAVQVSADHQVTAAGISILYGEIKTGTSVGAGTLVLGGNSTPYEPRILCGGATNTRMQHSSAYKLVAGLTPGADYNVSTRHYQVGGTGQFASRSINARMEM